MTTKQVQIALGPDIIGSRATLGVDSYTGPSARPALSFPNFSANLGHGQITLQALLAQANVDTH